MELSSSDKERIQHQYDALAKKTLVGEAKSHRLTLAKRAAREVTFSDLSESELAQLFTTDEYESDYFRFQVSGFDVLVKIKRFVGHLFDEVVFNDSVSEFIKLRERLANYFDESQTEDIFDYVPPQKTNQIFTPRNVVVQMVDLFEKENPGCFDDPSHTFADLYMKSGLYITEIIKRLYRSEGMKAAFPDDRERLDHILEHQVFGIAPTKIIYEIATHFILGFHDEVGQGCDSNFELADAAELAKEGTLEAYVERVFGPKLGEA